MTQNSEIKKVPLKVGGTLIETRAGEFEGDRFIFQTFYGNRVWPQAHDKFVHWDDAVYKRKLKEFLESEEGQKYTRPTEQEIELASQLVLMDESQQLSKQKQDTKIKEEIKKEPEPIQEMVQENINTKTDELESINLKKRVKAMFIVMIIQSLCIIALIGLRVFAK